jgi:hypothetical protein
MKNLVLSLFAVASFVSCQEKKVENFDLKLLNGYWEIEQVTTNDGSKKEYKMSEYIDFLQVKNDSGFRKKVTQQFDGTYLVNDSDEKFHIEKKPDGTYISYKTAYATWKEKIIALSANQLILENKQNIKYQYKKSTPFTVK